MKRVPDGPYIVWGLEAALEDLLMCACPLRWICPWRRLTTRCSGRPPRSTQGQCGRGNELIKGCPIPIGLPVGHTRLAVRTSQRGTLRTPASGDVTRNHVPYDQDKY